MALTLSHSIVVSPVGSTLCCGQLQQHVGDFRVSRLYETRKPKTIHVVAQVADVLQQQSLHVRSRIGDSLKRAKGGFALRYNLAQSLSFRDLADPSI